MNMIRRLTAFALALIVAAGPIPSFAQVPPPVPALPDTERRTSYSISASTCACSVGFQLYGDSTDVANWLEVFVNGVLITQSGNWSITSPTGSLATIPRPITDAILTFTTAQTGTVQIVGARRPRRTSQFQESQPVPTRNFNQTFSDIIATQRELWDKTNDVTGRAVLARPGETLALLPALASRANTGACFDSSGNLTSCVSVSGSTFVAGNGITFTGTNPTTIANNIQAGVSSSIVVSGTNPLVISGTPSAIPGGRLCLQMSGCVGGLPTQDAVAAATKVVFLSSGTTWTVPLDFTSTNTFEAVGATGGGGGSVLAGSTGSGGGAYAKSVNQTLTPGATVTVSIPTGGTPGVGAASGGTVADVYLCNTLVTNCASIAGSAVVVGAKSGAPGIAPGGSPSLGGTSAASIALGPGSAKFSGGNSGVGGGTSSAGGGGGAGPSGIGSVGANGSGATGGAGGAGDGGVVAGGALGSSGIPATLNTDSLSGRIATVSSGGGGASSGGVAGGCGGLGGGVGGGANGTNGATGCPGGIVITYSPNPTVLTYSPCGTYVPGCGSPFVPFYSGSATSPMAFGTFTSGLNDAIGLTLTLSVTDNTASNCYEVFYFNNTGAPVIGTGPALTSCTPGSVARAPTGGLATVGAILANTTASMTIKNNGSSYSCPQYQCTVLGMLHVGVNGQVSMQIKPGAFAGGANSELGLDNYFNKVPMRAVGHDSVSSYSYNLTAARSVNGSANNAISILDGLGVKHNTYGFFTSFTGSAPFAGTNELTLNQSCATGISGGSGQGALVTQTAGSAAQQGGPGVTFYSPYPIAGLTKMNACDGQVNASITVFGNDFMLYYIDTMD